MVLPEGLMAELKKRAKAKRRNGIFHRGGDSYLFRRKIRGNLYQIPFKAGNAKDAKQVYDQILLEISLGLHGGGTAPRLSAIIKAWVNLHRKQTEHVKNAKYAEESLRNVAKGQTPLPDLPLPSITTPRLEDWISHFQEDHAPATINLVLRYLKLWLRWAVDRGTPGLPKMPCKIKMQKVEPRVRPVVEMDDQAAFLAGIDCVKTWVKVSQLAELPVRAAARFMLGVGIREGQVLRARWEWLDLEARTYIVGKDKGGRIRVVKVPEWVVPWLQALPRTVSGWIFPGEDGQPHPHNWLRKALARGGRAAGIVGNLGNHRLRASFITRHAAEGTPLSDIQALVGHRDVSTTRGYVEENQDRLNAAQDRLAARLKGGA